MSRLFVFVVGVGFILLPVMVMLYAGKHIRDKQANFRRNKVK